MEIDGRLEGLQAYAIHGTPYYRAYFAHLDLPDDIQACQLPFDAIDEDLKPGDSVRITYLLKTVMQIRRAVERQ